MKQSTILWILALAITIGFSYYQRVTGPGHPVSGKVLGSEKEIAYKLARTHGGESDHSIQIQTNDPGVEGFVEWKRFKTQDEWRRVVMMYADGYLSASLPYQPPAGKLQYKVTLWRGAEVVTIPNDDLIVIRFKGDIPLAILIAHIAGMFMGMLLSTRTGLEVFAENPNFTMKIYLTLGFLILGGLILGPIVQKYAFGAYWTGWPFGTDLTDNKTAVAVLAWVIAAIALQKSSTPKIWVAVAAIVTFVIFVIPHSLMGSELDYSKMDSVEVNKGAE